MTQETIDSMIHRATVDASTKSIQQTARLLGLECTLEDALSAAYQMGQARGYAACHGLEVPGGSAYVWLNGVAHDLAAVAEGAAL
jgi:hypothetical protein